MDGSGLLSREEFEALNGVLGLGDTKKNTSINDLFTLLDVDNDGVLTEDVVLRQGAEVSEGPEIKRIATPCNIAHKCLDILLIVVLVFVLRTK